MGQRALVRAHAARAVASAGRIRQNAVRPSVARSCALVGPHQTPDPEEQPCVIEPTRQRVPAFRDTAHGDRPSMRRRLRTHLSRGDV